MYYIMYKKISTLFRWREVDTLAQPLAEEDDNIPVKHPSFFSSSTSDKFQIKLLSILIRDVT